MRMNDTRGTARGSWRIPSASVLICRVRILLAQAPHRDTFGYSMPPPGLLRLGGALRDARFEVELEDLAHALASGALDENRELADAACERLLARAETFENGFVLGMSVMGATVPIALAILERVVARAPLVRTVLGGPGTTGIDSALIERFACVHAVVRGEGEETLVELLRAWSRGADASGVAGVTWRCADGACVREEERAPLRDLTQLPSYAWDLLPPIAEYKRVTGGADGLVALDSGRGCVYDCSFCTIGRFWSRRSRVLPARELVAEIESLRSMPGATAAYLCHDIFGANRGHALSFCEQMLERGKPLPWEVRARADHLDFELLERMARAGCYRVLIGVESADAGVRERNQKGLRNDVDLLALVDDCARAGIVPILSLILGLPGEGERELRTTLDFCAESTLRAGVQLSLHLVNPQPGCGMYEEFGARARPVEGIPPDMAWGAGDTRAERELRDAHPDLFTTWALLPDDEAHLHALHAIASELPDVLMRYPRTWKLAARERGLDTLDLFRVWKQDGRSFETFVRAEKSALVEDALRWEQALVRVEARADVPWAPHERVSGPVFRGEIVELRHDVPALVQASESGAPTERATRLALVRGARGVQTLRVGVDAARWLARLDGRASVDELEAEQPGLRAVLENWSAQGWITLGTPAPSTTATNTRDDRGAHEPRPSDETRANKATQATRP